MTTNLRTPCLCAVFISGSPPVSISLSGMESDDCEVRCMISWVLLTALSSVIVSSWAYCRHNVSKNELNEYLDFTALMTRTSLMAKGNQGPFGGVNLTHRHRKWNRLRRRLKRVRTKFWTDNNSHGSAFRLHGTRGTARPIKSVRTEQEWHTKPVWFILWEKGQ